MMDTIEKVRSHYDAAIQDGDFVLFTGLYGSQNYKTDLPTSDVDTKTIVLPSFYRMVFGMANAIRERHMPDGSLMKVMSLQDYSRQIMKGSINFVELLFTDYFVVSDDGKEIFTWLRDNNERLARINPNGTLHACMGHLMRNFKEYQKHNEDEAKAVSNIFRLAQFMKNYSYELMTYKECLIVDSFYCRDIRTRFEEKDITALLQPAMETAEKYLNTYKDVEANEELVDELNHQVYQTYRKLIV